ncbi:hypothetical protein, partial [Mycobacterium avium]|uniref:hypothetical protein n=1 Tax=Mycobacterium avium TaxID=1764 RepID=UPI001E457129
MLAAFGFESLGVVVGDMYFIDPDPLEGQETPERGVRLELRLVDRDEPQGSIYAGVPITFGRPVWRVGPFGSPERPPRALDRAHHHPRFHRREPHRRHPVSALSLHPPALARGGARPPPRAAGPARPRTRRRAAG